MGLFIKHEDGTIEPAIRQLNENEIKVYNIAIVKAVTQVPAFRDSLALLRPFKDATAQTAYTDRYSRVGLGEWFFTLKSEAQQATVLLHEAFHVLNNAFSRGAALGADPTLMNASSDLEINCGLYTNANLDISFGILPTRKPFDKLEMFKTMEQYYHTICSDKDLMDMLKPPPCPVHGDNFSGQNGSEPTSAGDSDDGSDQSASGDGSGSDSNENNGDSGSSDSGSSGSSSEPGEGEPSSNGVGSHQANNHSHGPSNKKCTCPNGDSGEGDSGEGASSPGSGSDNFSGQNGSEPTSAGDSDDGSDQSASGDGSGSDSNENNGDSGSSDSGSSGSSSEPGEGEPSSNGVGSHQANNHSHGPSNKKCTCPNGDSGEGDSGEGASSPGSGSGNSSRGIVCDESTQDRAESADDAGIERASESEQSVAKKNTQARVEEEIKKARAAGDGHAENFYNIALQNMAPPKVDWRKILQRVLSRNMEAIVRGRSDYSYRRYSRRFTDSKFIFPGMVQYNPKMIMGIDTSGSMSHEDHLRACSEIEGFLKSTNRAKNSLSVFTVDTQVSNMKLVDNVKQLDLIGGGGTAMEVAWQYVETLKKSQQPDLFCLVTDGYLGDYGWANVEDEVRKSRSKFPSIILVTTKNGYESRLKSLDLVATVIAAYDED